MSNKLECSWNGKIVFMEERWEKWVCKRFVTFWHRFIDRSWLLLNNWTTWEAEGWINVYVSFSDEDFPDDFLMDFLRLSTPRPKFTSNGSGQIILNYCRYQLHRNEMQAFHSRILFLMKSSSSFRVAYKIFINSYRQSSGNR